MVKMNNLVSINDLREATCAWAENHGYKCMRKPLLSQGFMARASGVKRGADLNHHGDLTNLIRILIRRPHTGGCYWPSGQPHARKYASILLLLSYASDQLGQLNARVGQVELVGQAAQTLLIRLA